MKELENINDSNVVEDNQHISLEVNTPPKKRKTKVKGLGDVVKVVTDVLGIEQCDECIERQFKLNKMFPFTKTANMLNEDDMLFVDSITTFIHNDDRRRFEQLVRDTFNEKFIACNCPNKYKDALERLRVQVSYQREISSK